MDPAEACDKLRLTIKVLGSFKACYFDYKVASKQEVPDNPWKFQNSAIFGRLDAFLERCNDMLSLEGTCVQFSRLERVEIGGSKGKMLTGAIKQVHADFLVAHDKFRQVSSSSSSSSSSCHNCSGNDCTMQ
jgi:dynein heavy chain